MFIGFLAILYVHVRTPLLWTWYVPFSATVTFVTGALASLATTQNVPGFARSDGKK
jgi:hypothetical protein